MRPASSTSQLWIGLVDSALVRRLLSWIEFAPVRKRLFAAAHIHNHRWKETRPDTTHKLVPGEPTGQLWLAQQQQAHENLNTKNQDASLPSGWHPVQYNNPLSQLPVMTSSPCLLQPACPVPPAALAGHVPPMQHTASGLLSRQPCIQLAATTASGG